MAARDGNGLSESDQAGGSSLPQHAKELEPHDVFRPARRDPLNFFEPWEGRPAYHEDQLTRGLLVALRCSPMAHQVWLTLIQGGLPSEEGRQLYELPDPEFNTQQRRVLGSALNERDSIEGISVLISGEDSQTTAEGVAERGRDQVLDGIIRYGDSLVVVIESKLGGRVRTQQHEQINLYGQPVKFGKPVVVRWDVLLAAFGDLVAKELVAGAERAILSDFLSLVDKYFPRIAPFPTLARCGSHEFRVSRRLRALLSEASEEEARMDQWVAWVDLSERMEGVASRACLRYASRPEPGSVELSVYPADTLTQARALYAGPGKVAAVSALAKNPGWRVTPHFHFGHMQTGYVWCSGGIETGRYLELWQQKIKDARAITREGWPRYWTWLMAEGIAAPENRNEFEQTFTRTGRSTATPRPGLDITYGWPIREAEGLDASDKLVDEVRQAIAMIVSALRS